MPIVLRHFIGDVLGIPQREIRRARLRNTFLWRKHRKEKLGILDVAVELNDDTKIDIELRVNVYDGWHKRQLFYLSKLFAEDLLAGQDYSLLKKCVGISVLDFNLTDRKKYHTVYRLRDEEGNELSDILELHTIELKKKLTGQGEIDNWIRFFNAGTEEDLDMIKTDNPGILTAIGELRRMSLSRPPRRGYEAYLKKVRDEKAWKAHVRKTAMSEGSAQGMAQGMVQGVAESVLELLKIRGQIPEKPEKTILSESDGEKLRQWLILASKSQSVDEFQELININEGG